MKSRIAQLALAGAVAGTMMLPAISSAQEAAGPNTGKLSLEAGVDVVTQYIFRGYSQENEGIIAQPWANLGFSVYKSADGPISDVSLKIGTWNSFQTEITGSSGAWYEADLSLGVEATIMKKWTAGLSYIWYVYPDAAISTIQEVDLKIGYNDKGMFPDIMGRPFALQPYVLFAFETDNPNGNEGIYAEVGIAPQWTIDNMKDWPITLTIPMTVGLSLDDYYLDPVTGKDDIFGYVSVGAIATVPLKFIPSDYGQWSAKAGVMFYYLGDNAADSSAGIIGLSGNQFQVVGIFGVNMTY